MSNNSSFDSTEPPYSLPPPQKNADHRDRNKEFPCFSNPSLQRRVKPHPHTANHHHRHHHPSRTPSSDPGGQSVGSGHRSVCLPCANGAGSIRGQYKLVKVKIKVSRPHVSAALGPAGRGRACGLRRRGMSSISARGEHEGTTRGTAGERSKKESVANG